jgi:CRISPR-associated protein Cmr4
MKKHTSVWMIVPQTNLHVGNESIVNFSVIDKAIQRDVITGIPCINSSSLKGAIKEYLENKQFENIKELFGSTRADRNNSQKGSALFFDATLLAIPEQRVGENSPYKLVYSKQEVDNFLAKAKTLGAKDFTLDTSKWEESKKFNSLCSDDNLPIIARNCLENGESTNLWYEQVLPSQSVLATIIQTYNADDLDILNGAIVQIGANATIGYGYCKFIKLS